MTPAPNLRGQRDECVCMLVPKVFACSDSLSISSNKSSEVEIIPSPDKLTLVIPLPAQLAQGLTEYLYGWLSDKEEFQKLGLTRANGAASRGYKLSIHGRVPSQDDDGAWSSAAGFLFQAGSRQPDLPPIRLDINPGCLNPHGFMHLRKVIEENIQIDWHWLQQSRATRLDMAIDAHGCNVDDWVWDILKKRKRNLFIGNGCLRTLNLGSKHGDQVTIYDKARQLKLPPDTRWCRIEFKKRRLGPVQDLPKMGCPLADLLVFDPTVTRQVRYQLPADIFHPWLTTWDMNPEGEPCAERLDVG